MLLTKTIYLQAMQCPKQAWLARKRPELRVPWSQSQVQAFETGRVVGLEARRCFAGGRLTPAAARRAVAATQRLLATGVAVLYEAAFQYDGILVRCDILAKQGDGRWTIVEVKSTTGVRPEHLHDLAIQRYVVEGSGLAVGSLNVMYISPATCCYPDLSNLFAVDDVTAAVQDLMRDVAARAQSMREMLAEPEEPAVAIGLHCDEPHECPFKSHCWRNAPKPSVFTLAGLGRGAKLALAERGIVAIEDIPADFPLTAKQRAQVALHTSQTTAIDRDAVATLLAALIYPVYFLDFETDAPAIPRFMGMRPYQPYPFQFSCHVLHADGRLEHCDFLHVEQSDPRGPLADQLRAQIGERGSIVAYNVQFERRVLAHLADFAPEHARSFNGMIARLWDQLVIFRRHYRSAAFKGSNSLKNVLPAMVPALSYDGLSVRSGDQAWAVWRELVQSEDAAHRQRLATELRAYCTLDTLAMVEIHRALLRVIGESRQ